MKAPRRVGAPPAAPRALEVSAFGMSLHATTVIDGRDRKRLERMCRYLRRPPFAQEVVRELPDGRVRLAFKAPTRTGATHVDLEPHRFLARLGLAPPPRQHQVRYFGVFSNHHDLRARIRPDQGQPLPDAPTHVPLFDTDGIRPSGALTSLPPTPASRARIGWAKLVARVFIAAITDADDIARIFHGARPPPRQSHVDQLCFFAE